MDIKPLTANIPRTDSASSGGKPQGGASVAGELKASEGSRASAESLTLTQTAQTLSAARDDAGTVPFNEAKVEEIKAAIAEGRYPIDNERLAERMLRYEGLLM